jgi:hypothetical protein
LTFLIFNISLIAVHKLASYANTRCKNDPTFEQIPLPLRFGGYAGQSQNSAVLQNTQDI